jgi:hypothetical protein
MPSSRKRTADNKARALRNKKYGKKSEHWTREKDWTAMEEQARAALDRESERIEASRAGVPGTRAPGWRIGKGPGQSSR